MSLTRIVYVGLVDGGGDASRGEDCLLPLARGVVAASRHTCTVELISQGLSGACRIHAPGVLSRILRIDNPGVEPEDAVSWELPQALAGAHLVHIHGGSSRISQLALLLARHARQPVCLSEYALDPHALNVELALWSLADVVLCHSPAILAALHGSAPVSVLCGGSAFGIDASAAGGREPEVHGPRIAEQSFEAAGMELLAVYRGLLAGRWEAAA